MNEPDADTRRDAREILYDELRAVARRYMARERAGHTLQPTALVHEAFVRLHELPEPGASSSVHFRAAASTLMRQILIDHARHRGAQKRGGDLLRITLLDPADREAETDPVDLLELDDAMRELRDLHERKGRLVELRFFGGLTNDEAAEVLGVSPKTTERDWYLARAWLRRRLAAR